LKVFIAGLLHESCTFSPIETDRRSFESFEYHRPENGEVDDKCKVLNGYGAFVRHSIADNHIVYASSYAFAQPSAPCSRECYESLRDEILGDLADCGPVDIAFFFLHGAQSAVGYDDCEGDLLAAARSICGTTTFIGVLLDLHANVSEEMLASADALVACRLYPHVDFDERAQHLYRLAANSIAKNIKLKTHFRRVPMLGLFYTTEPRMMAANERAWSAQESPGVQSVSLIHGFPWSDSLHASAAILVITDESSVCVDQIMTQLHTQFFAAREETRDLRKPIENILDEISSQSFTSSHDPFVIADACDNPGGGASSDSTFILEAILKRGDQGFALALFWDPETAELAKAAGTGNRVQIALGGKFGSCSGRTIRTDARVLRVTQDTYQSGIGFEVKLGLAVALEIGGNTIIVNTVRGQVLSPTCFTDLGIDISKTRALVVKSTQHFFDQFAPIARKVYYCETKGLMALDLDGRGYSNIRRPLWPFDPMDGTSRRHD